MTPGERGFLLLTSHLGDPQRRPLTVPQFRTLAQRVQNAEKETDPRDLIPGDLTKLGYGAEDARRIVTLLAEEDLLDHYLRRANKALCAPLPRVSPDYPQELRVRLGGDAPGVLWYRGDIALPDRPKIALVGSRQLLPENAEFAREVGIQAARQGFTLVSGNAIGADRTAQDACLAEGGRVISVVADELDRHAPSEQILYLCEDSFDFGFHRLRALSRNRVIHALGFCTLVAQCSLSTGGTWDGTTRNLHAGWSPVFCFDDGREGTRELAQLGAQVIGTEDLEHLNRLAQPPKTLFDR